VDDNCNGVVDEGCACTNGYSRLCGSSVGACKPGAQKCTAGVWGACTGGVGPAPEVCDGSVDDNCNGVVDEGCACTNGYSRLCGSSVGACKQGLQTCAAGAWGVCTGGTGPATEACDGVDNNCNGVVDEGCGCTNGQVMTCGSNVGRCRVGTQTCTNGAWGSCAGAVGPVTEVCDGVVDDNCNGQVDEGCACTNGATRSCGSAVGACKPGTQTCANGAWAACTGGVSAVTEVCNNGLDDDCDGVVDDGCAKCTDVPYSFTFPPNELSTRALEADAPATWWPGTTLSAQLLSGSWDDCGVLGSFVSTCAVGTVAIYNGPAVGIGSGRYVQGSVRNLVVGGFAGNFTVRWCAP
jgi:hypothetical protein